MKTGSTGFRMDCGGFTLLEILAVLLLLGVLGAVAVPRFLDMASAARDRAVSAAVAELNGREKAGWAREMLRTQESPLDEDIFAEVVSGSLGPDFSWAGAPVRRGSSELLFRGQSYGVRRIASDGLKAAVWSLFSGILHDFEAAVPSTFIQQPVNTWSADPALGFSTTDWGARIYTPNPLGDEPYEISVRAALGVARPDVANPDGGYGVFFDAVLNENEQIQSGYILQFDRGMGAGEIILRRWENGSEVSTPVMRINDRSLIPRDTVDPGWWTQEHDLAVRVTEVEGQPGQRQLAVVLDGAVISSGFTFEATGGGTYTGLRSWGSFESPSEFNSLEIRSP